MKTVFFGPFIGEFGWELLYWQGWVRKVCLGEYKDYKKIAASCPGREPFYPYVDEFWPHPDEFLSFKNSQRGYHADYWKNGFPKGSYAVRHWKYGIFPSYKYEVLGAQLPDFEPVVVSLLEKYKAMLPKNAIYYSPFQWNCYEKDNLEFGVKYTGNPQSNEDFFTKRIDFKYQLLEPIQPSKKGIDIFKKKFGGGNKLIAIFPRNRTLRRSDKNWPKENYNKLIQALLEQYGHKYNIGIFGAPGGAFYADGVPEGTLDFINLPDSARMDVQVAALQNAVFAIGGMSGAILFSLACGCPTITWGHVAEMNRYHRENFTNTDFIYYPKMYASVNEILRLCKSKLEGDRYIPGDIIVRMAKIYLSLRQIVKAGR